VRAIQIARRLPRMARRARPHFTAMCEVAGMLADGVGLPPSVQALLAHLTERWDGKGPLGRAKGEEIPLPMRIVHVAVDATFQRLLGGDEHAVRVLSERAGSGLDPEVAACLADDGGEILALDAEVSAWDEVLAREPHPRLTLEGEAVDRALGSMGNFADLISPYLGGHSAGVAELAAAAAARCRLDTSGEVALRRAALSRSPFLAALAPVACAHHERLDGSGYHRGVGGADLALPARLLAAADAFHAMTEPRPYREPLPPEAAAETLADEAGAGRLDPDAVAAVVEAAGQRAPRIERPAGLTEREAEVVGMLARGLQTKQVARALGISVKTADRHVQNAYRKIGVSTRAAATLFAMEHGLVAWGELPIARPAARP
jgi:HD-GYP domain-containing protein (c-di-GMP phosphodiesterase class II)